MMAPRADGSLPGELFQGVQGALEMVFFQRSFGRDAVLPHMVRHLVAFSSCGAHGIRIKLADPPGRENSRLDIVIGKQFEKAPDADSAAELSLGELQRRLVE